MLKKLINRILRHRHPWRVAFDELSEIYVAMLVRGLSVSMVGLFVPVYMLKLHYSVVAIVTMMIYYFIARVVADFLAAVAVGRYGPKHVLITGQAILVISSVLFLTLQTMQWPLFLLGAVWGIAQSCYFVSFDVDFSKIKHSKHAGKELSYVETMTKIGAISGPLLGALVSSLWGPQYIFLVSTALLVLGLSPLLKTREPLRPGLKLQFRRFPVRKLTKHVLPVVAMNIENNLSLVLWPIFLTLFVLSRDNAFTRIGILAAVSTLVSISFAHVVGRMVDAHNGRSVLRANAMLNAVVHLVRPLMRVYPAAFGLSMVNELVSVGYRLPFFKGYFDEADQFSDAERIVFIGTLEALSSLCKLAVFVGLLMLAVYVSDYAMLTVGFMVAAMASLLMTTERFKAYHKRA